MRLLTTTEFARLTGITGTGLYELNKSGAMLPEVPGRKGGGGTAYWSPSQVLGIAIARGIRRLGVDVPHSTAVARYLAGMTEAQLEAEFAAGRTHLGVIPPFAHAALSPQKDILENGAIARQAVLIASMSPMSIDVERVWNNLKAAVADIDQKKVVQKNAQPQLSGPKLPR